MTESEALAKMVAPGQIRPSKPYRGGVIQIHVTRACDRACFCCTQGSNLGGKTEFMSPEHFEQAVLSLKGYFGVYGTFGGNPALSRHFEEYCAILRKHVPFEQRGLWCNNPLTPEKARAMRATYNPAVSNLNVHLDAKAARLFREHWPEAHIVGEHQDSRHSPPFVAMRDVLKKSCPRCGGAGNIINPKSGSCVERIACPDCSGTGHVYDEGKAWDLISRCDVNQHWSAMIGVFRGQLRAWFCEIAGAQSILHQDEPDYPDTGMPVDPGRTGPILHGGRQYEYWWQLPMTAFSHQVRKHCLECGVPLRGHGELAQAPDDRGREYVSATHAAVYKLKRPRRSLVLVTDRAQLGEPLAKMVDYIGNSTK